MNAFIFIAVLEVRYARTIILSAVSSDSCIITRSNSYYWPEPYKMQAWAASSSGGSRSAEVSTMEMLLT